MSVSRGGARAPFSIPRKVVVQVQRLFVAFLLAVLSLASVPVSAQADALECNFRGRGVRVVRVRRPVIRVARPQIVIVNGRPVTIFR